MYTIITAGVSTKTNVEDPYSAYKQPLEKVKRILDYDKESMELEMAERLLAASSVITHLLACEKEEFLFVLKNYHKLRELITLNDRLKREEERFKNTIGITLQDAVRHEEMDARWAAIESITANSSGI